MSPHSSRLGTCFTLFKIPSVTAQHSVGKPDFRNPRQPLVVLPSNRSFHPADSSLSVRTFWTTDFPLPAAPIEKDRMMQTIANDANHRSQIRKLQQPGDPMKEPARIFFICLS